MDIDIQKLIAASEKGAKILKKYFGSVTSLKEKSIPSNFFTEADLQSEAEIIKYLKKNFKNVNILSEENGFFDRGSDYTFIIDPLDGTSNFVMGIPNFSVNIALVKKDEIIAGVVDDPMRTSVYYAKKGKGAFLNGKKIKTGRTSEINKVNLGYDCDYGYYLNDFFIQLAQKLNQLSVKRLMVNMSPALDLCRVASGKMEAYINNANEIYDYAAGKLIIKEAGGRITSFEGDSAMEADANKFLASNGTRIHDEILKILKK